MTDRTVTYLDFTEKSFKETNKYIIDTIMIKNPEKWKVAKLPDFLEQSTADTKHKQTVKRKKEKTVSQENLENNLMEKIDTMEDEEVLVINEDVHVTEYAPYAFNFLRTLDDIDNQTVRESLSPDANRDSVFKAGESQGKSGSFFFFSHDKKFIIKTMTDSDLSTFKKLFKQYFQGVSTRRNSLLARIYGIYTIKMEEVAPVHLILMGNTKKSNDKNIVNIFDLKGSFINREVEGKNLKPTATLKDLNLLEICKGKNLLMFRPEDQKEIMENMERDAIMLRDKNIMDYSLLLAVEKNPEYEAFVSNHPMHKMTLTTAGGDLT